MKWYLYATLILLALDTILNIVRNILYPVNT